MEGAVPRWVRCPLTLPEVAGEGAWQAWLLTLHEMSTPCGFHLSCFPAEKVSWG